MSKPCKITLNDESFLSNCGDLLLDSALMNGVDLPHDCRSGVCGACRVRLVSGSVFGGHERGGHTLHACQARLLSDIEIVTEPVPDTIPFTATVTDVVPLAPDVVGVAVSRLAPLPDAPGSVR